MLQPEDDFMDEEKKLDQALDDSKKKTRQVPKKVKSNKPKKETKKKKVEKATAETSSTFTTDTVDSVVEDTVLKPEVKKENLLQLEEEDEIDWESDLDVNEILNRQISKDPYLTACEALNNLVPVSQICKNLISTELILPFHGIGPLGARALGKVLETNMTVETVNLANNGIDHGGRYLASSVCLNHSITFLDLSNNNLKSAGAEIATLIADNSTIKTLILSGNMFGDKEAELISNGLKDNQFLHDLSKNEIGDIGGMALGMCLQSNESLRDLNLSWNHLRSRGLQAIFQGAKDNSSLVSLNLSHNGIGDQALGLGEFLSKTQVTKLDLGFTRISDQSAPVLIKGIDSNRSITELDISGNSIGSESLANLFKALPNSRVTNLIMKHIRLTNETLKIVEGIRQENNLTIAE